MDCHSSDVFQPVASDPGAAEILPLDIMGDGFVIVVGFAGLVVIINIIRTKTVERVWSKNI